MSKYKRIILKLLIITFMISSFPIYFVFADPLDSWQSPKAYKPKPVLFLHGFAKGSPLDWNGTKTALNVHFSKYQPLGSYLETIDFQDSNGSVDRYPSGKFNPQGNSAGWADKVKNKVDELLNSAKYGSYTNKLNIVCHSMGGLAARWYLANYSSDFVDKLILKVVRSRLFIPIISVPLAIAQAASFLLRTSTRGSTYPRRSPAVPPRPTAMTCTWGTTATRRTSARSRRRCGGSKPERWCSPSRKARGQWTARSAQCTPAWSCWPARPACRLCRWSSSVRSSPGRARRSFRTRTR